MSGPAFTHPLTGEQLLTTRDVGWLVLALRNCDGHCVAIGSYRALDFETRHLGRLIVDPARRGQGLGRALTERLIARASGEPGITTVTLNGFAHNTVARALYASLGFVETSTPSGNDPWYTVRMRRTTIAL